MDLSLSEAERALQAKARDFCEEVLQPHERDVEEAGHLPEASRAALKRAVLDWGFGAINHARENGGQGYSLFEQALINEQMGRASNGLWSVVWQPAICLAAGSDGQKEAYLKPACRGDRRACYAVTEEGAGSDPRMIETQADRDGDGFRLTGVKWFVTGFDAADFLVVQAHVDGDRELPTLFLVNKDSPGLRHLRSPRFTHNYPFDHAEVEFRSVEVGADQVLGEVGSGYELTKDWFVEARMQIAAHTIGGATRAAEVAESYASERVQFGRAIRDFQGIEFQIADMAVELMAAKTLLYRVAWEIDSGLDRKLVHARASALKLYASEVAGRVADRAVQILGGRGYMRENPVERLSRDLRVDRIWEGTSEVQRAVIGGQIRKRGLEVYTGWS